MSMTDLSQLVDSQRQVITYSYPMLVGSLSANAAAYNLILDELIPNSGMPHATHADMQLKKILKEGEKATIVRNFLQWLMSVSDAKVFETFYAALSKHGLKSELNTLQKHTLFPEAYKIVVSTCHSVSIPYTCT